MLITASLSETELFAVATQFYVRLRRINGRVIDVQYMIENREYAAHVLKYAETIIDEELQRHLKKLKDISSPKVGIEETSSYAQQHNTDTEMNKVVKSSSNANKATWFLG